MTDTIRAARGAGALRRALLVALATLAGLAFAAPQALAGAVIDNGTVRLGVGDLGQLNFNSRTGLFGVNYIPTGNDGTRAGCECEGWGAGAGGPGFSGTANNSSGIRNASLVSFTSTASSATSVVDVAQSDGSPGLRVTHEYVPSPNTPNLYEIEITLENRSGGTLNDVRYERIMDWDVEPTPFSEFVTIQRGATPPTDLIYSDDNGFSDNDPFTSDGPLDPSTVNTNYTDLGPRDHGARFTFGFGDLEADEEKTFLLFYGAAGTEPTADAAVSAAALELYSYGQPEGGETTGEPNTFIFGFRGVGGAAIIPPTLSLTPETATNDTGDPHTVSAELKDSSGNPVPGADIVFEVTGANPQPAATRTTDAMGKASYTYTGANAGADTIKACLDANANDACDEGEVTDTASKTYVAGEPEVPQGKMNGKGTVTDDGMTAAYAYIVDCAQDTGKFQGKLGGKTFKTLTGTRPENVVNCIDDPDVPTPSAGFDTAEGTLTGTYDGKLVSVEFTMVDGGADVNDTASLTIRDEAFDVVFSASGAPPGPFPGSRQPTGFNVARP